MNMQSDLFNYHLPPELIAQEPVQPRDRSRLMLLDRESGVLSHQLFYEIVDELQKGDVLVLNKSKVFKARLRGQIKEKDIEVFLLRHERDGLWQAMIKPGKKVVVGDVINLDGLQAKLLEQKEDGTVLLDLEATVDQVLAYTDKHGEIPVPPYVKKQPEKFATYQTVYAKNVGSVAAPTAGFHFTKHLIDELKDKGVQFEFVTLHVGLGTFRPIKTKTIEEHQMHSEFVQIDRDTSGRINQAKQEGRRVIAVGTTTVRSLEGVAQCHSEEAVGRRKNVLDKKILTASEAGLRMTSTLPDSGFAGDVNLFIKPGFQFKIVDALITNFHLPKSTLLVLVSAFAGRGNVLATYREAIKQKYRFYSFGDAMFIR